jgi:hypothetical protein
MNLRRRLKEAVQRPHITGAQPLEPNPDADVTALGRGDDPPHIARHLDRFGLGGNMETQAHHHPHGQRFSSFEVHPAERQIPAATDLFLPVVGHLNAQLPIVAGIYSSKMLCQGGLVSAQATREYVEIMITQIGRAAKVRSALSRSLLELFEGARANCRIGVPELLDQSVALDSFTSAPLVDNWRNLADA